MLPLDAFDLQRDAGLGKVNDTSGSRNAADPGQDQSAERIIPGVFGQGDSRHAFELIKTDGGIDSPDIFPQRFQRFIFLAVRIGEGADDFGNQIGIRDDSGGSAELGNLFGYVTTNS